MSEQNTETSSNPGTACGDQKALPAAPFGEVFARFLKPRQYFTEINGRARRGEYWCAALLLLLPTTILSMIVGFVSVSAGSLALFMVLMLPVSAVGMFMLPVTVRRWHDLGYTGWLAVATQAIVGFPCAAIPVLGSVLGLIASIACLVFFCIPGTKGNNQFGADPLDSAAIDPAESRKEPWKPILLAYAGLVVANWAWGVYTTYTAIKMLKSLSSFFS